MMAAVGRERRNVDEDDRSDYSELTDDELDAYYKLRRFQIEYPITYATLTVGDRPVLWTDYRMRFMSQEVWRRE